MMNNHNENLLEICTTLIEQGFYNQAKDILEPMNCAMACYLKGRICLIEAYYLLKNITIHGYVSAESKSFFNKFVSQGNKYISETSDKLQHLKPQFYDYVQQHLLRDHNTLLVVIEIAKKYFEIDSKTPIDEDVHNFQVSVDNVIERMENWNLNPNLC